MMNRMRDAFGQTFAESDRGPQTEGGWRSPPWNFSPRALLLDLCGVLIDDTLWSRWLFQLVSRIGLHSHYQLFWRVWQQDYQQAVNLGQREYWDALREFLASSGLSRGQIDEVCYAAFARRRHLDETVRPFPGIKTTLAKLQVRGWRLGVIANSPRSAMETRQRLERMGIASPFDLITSSRDHADADPPHTKYHRIGETWQLSSDQVVFVSTNALEIESAERSGMLTVSMPRTPWEDDRLTVDGLDELLPWLPGDQFRSRAG